MTQPDLAERLIVEQWTGTIASTDLQRVGELIGHYGSAYGAALQMLLMRRAEFRTVAASRSAGDDRQDHTANLKAVEEQIQGLVAAMGALESYTPSQAEAVLMVSATASPGQSTSTIDLLASSPRRG